MIRDVALEREKERDRGRQRENRMIIAVVKSKWTKKERLHSTSEGERENISRFFAPDEG